MNATYAYTPFFWPMFVSALFSAALSVYAWRHRQAPGASALAIHTLGVALWALFTAIEMMATTTPAKVLYHKLEAAAAEMAMGAMLYFALQRASAAKWATRRIALALSLVTLGFILLIATDHLHHLLWTRLWFDRFMRVERGPLGPLFLGWTFFVVFLSPALFLWLLFRSVGIYRRQALLLCIGSILPVLTFLLEFAGINPIAPLDPVILVWNVSSALYALAIFRFRLLAVVPIGRDMAIERMARGMLILDADDRIVDMNPAVAALLGLRRQAAIGRPASQALGAYPSLLQLLATRAAARAEIVLPEPERPRHIQGQATPLTHPGGFHLGRLIVLQDVTEERQAQALILEQQRALAAEQERMRVARELHDELGQVLGYVKMQAQAARDRLAQDEKAMADAYLAQLIQATQEAHADVREYILGARLTADTQLDLLSTLGEYLKQFTANYRIHTELAATPDLGSEAFEPMVQTQLLRIIQEALTNTRKHASAQSVQVRLEREDARARVIIQDDGVGYDPEVRASGEGGHYGLRFMQERAQGVGGTVTVQSSPGQGTRVVVEVPLGGGGR